MSIDKAFTKENLDYYLKELAKEFRKRKFEETVNEIFSGQKSTQYFEGIKNRIKAEIESLSDTEIITCDFAEWKDYIYSKYSVVPITLFEENIEQSLSERKVRRYNPYYEKISYEKEYFDVDGYCISFKIYFDGNPDLFDLQPNYYISQRFITPYFSKPQNDDCGYFILELIYTKQEIERKADLQDSVKREFENEFKNYRIMI